MQRYFTLHHANLADFITRLAEYFHNHLENDVMIAKRGWFLFSLVP